MSKSNAAETSIETPVAATSATEVPSTTSAEVKKNRIERDGYELSKLYEEFKTTSGVIRKLHSMGYTRSEISTFTGKIYQHVRNVLVQDAFRASQKK